MNLKQDTLPLYNKLVRHSKVNPISFHVPGHKYGSVFSNIKNPFTELLKIDVTELRGLDDLHSPSGIIKEAEDLTAELYKVERSYFLVGGSTVGNLAMILSTCHPGTTILVQRNSHKSIINGIRLANANPIFLTPEYDYEGQMATNVSYHTVELAIKEFPEAKVLILTSPNYYGMVSKDLQSIIQLAHSCELIVLVDEAHGAHLILDDPFPPSALQFGADMVVQSAHKTLPAMTMGSFLHYNSHRIDKDKVEYYLQVIQSSSPSYPIMASLDLARYYLAHISINDKAEILYFISQFRQSISNIPQLTILKSEDDTNKGDPLKLIVQTRCNLTGFELQRMFEEKDIYTEMADLWNVLFVLPLAPIKDWLDIIQKIKDSVLGIPRQQKEKQMVANQTIKMTKLALSFNEMEKYPKIKIPLKQMEGHIAATSIIPYPPGIPIILPGERITTSHIEMLLSLVNTGAYIQNSGDLWKNGIDVFKLS